MRKSLFLMFAVGMGAIAGCDDGQANVLGGIPSIAYLQRAPAGTGNVFDYLSGGGNDNIFTLTPPTATGTKKNLTQWTNASINSFDLSFDAREIVFSAEAPGDDHYHLYRIGVDGTNPCDAALGKVTMGACQITDGPYDEVYPIYVPGGRIFYLTNAERRRAGGRRSSATSTSAPPRAQVATMQPRRLGQRRSAPATSRTAWRRAAAATAAYRHRVAPPRRPQRRPPAHHDTQDMTGIREGFGGEGTGAHQQLPARQATIAPGHRSWPSAPRATAPSRRARSCSSTSAARTSSDPVGGALARPST